MSQKTRIPSDGHFPEQSAGVTRPRVYVAKGPDGVEKRHGARRPSWSTYQGRLTAVEPDRALAATEAIQVAIWHVIRNLVIHRHDLHDLVTRADLQSSCFGFNRVIFDMPGDSDLVDPLPMAAIVPAGECVYDQQGFQAVVEDGTLDAYGEGTVLRKIGSARQRMAIHVLSKGNDERRGVRRALETALLAERDDDQVGRIVVVPEYWDRTVRLMIQSTDDGDASRSVISNHLELVTLIDADLDVYELVRAPAAIRRPIIGVSTTP